MPLVCPLCCEEEFTSDESLRNHLLSVAERLHCPKCLIKIANIETLAEHLCECSGLTDREVTNQLEQMQPNIAFEQEEAFENDKKYITFSIAKDDNSVLKMDSLPLTYLKHNQLSVVSDGMEQILLVGNQDQDGLLVPNNMISSQNEDNSFTQTSSEMASKDSDYEDVLTEMYSCSTCGMSFHSVLDHIQTYHNEHDVIVQVTDADGVKLEKAVESSNDCETEEEQQDVVLSNKVLKNEESIVEEQVTDKEGRTYIRRFVQINLDNFVNQEQSKENGAADDTTKEQKMPAKKLQCVKCSALLKNTKSLNAHMRLHKKPKNKSPISSEKNGKEEDEKPGTFCCEECNTVFATNKSLRLHKRMHLPIKPRPLDCPIEGWEGEPDDSYLCSVCDRRIHSAYREAHEFHHATSSCEQHACNICNRKFVTAAALDMHSNIHKNQGAPSRTGNEDKGLPYACTYCARTFARPHEKVKHERVHTGEKPHACDICGKRFRVAYCLTLHMRTHNGARPYACPHCPKRFKSQSVFTHHMLTHSEERAYKCPYCPKAFKTSVQLSGHKNSHTKPFSCTHCNRPFASLYAVRSHMAIHLRENSLRFSCGICGATYARTFALKDHIRLAHAGQEEQIEEHLTTEQVNKPNFMIVESSDVGILELKEVV